jgi:hypothetical protein
MLKGILKKIGNLISILLLGDSRDLIIRTDEAVKRIDRDFEEVKRDVKSIDRRVGRIEGHLGLAPIVSRSPLHLTEIGEKILKESGIKQFVEERKEELLKQLKEENYTSAYDVQEWCFKIFDQFSNQPEFQEPFKDYAFQTGYSFDEIFEVGAIYFRDIALKELGLKIENLNNL